MIIINISLVLFFLSIACIFWAMIGYPLSLILLNKVLRKQNIDLNESYKPFVSIIVPAHNEEKCIGAKIENLIKLKYPNGKIEIIIASDNSIDNTNLIVNEYILKGIINLKLYNVKNRMGKTNALNEAHKISSGEILVFSDANSILDENAIDELVSFFSDNSVSYVTGRLVYTNQELNDIANLENSYWSLDLRLRQIESNIQTITAGNGALYACRSLEFPYFKARSGHDAALPAYFAKKGKKALFNPRAIAYEKAGESLKDEFKRKVRMNRNILGSLLPKLWLINIIKLKWFTYFYFGHRLLRKRLWFYHIILYLTNAIIVYNNFLLLVFAPALAAQTIFFTIGGVAAIYYDLKNKKAKLKVIGFIMYYSTTIYAQILGAIKQVFGKSKPFWEKAESTR